MFKSKNGKTDRRDLLKFIQKCIKQRNIIWTYHVNLRLEQRSILRKAIIESVNSYEIIEEYPKDKYLPSYLVYTKYQGNPVHIQFAIDQKDGNVRIITTYKPTLDKWEKDFKTRKAKK